ncbi:MAG: hypothetical protein LBL26_04270 [Peptococcaceae bacterium]|nr:hypothetical protein [Peptococcaceae bacterium]
MEERWINSWENQWRDDLEQTALKLWKEGLDANQITHEMVSVSNADQNWKKDWIGGWIKGWMEGEESKAFNLAWNLLSMGMDEELVFRSTGLSGEAFAARRDAQLMTGKIKLLLMELKESLERCEKAGLMDKIDMGALSGPIEQCYETYRASKAQVTQARKESEIQGLLTGEKSKASNVVRSLWKAGFNVEMIYVATQLPVESILSLIKE